MISRIPTKSKTDFAEEKIWDFLGGEEKTNLLLLLAFVKNRP